ncbi:MAG: protein-disulfide reductase DsbD domain-containing protein [Tepidisphaeraceae bacterium]
MNRSTPKLFAIASIALAVLFVTTSARAAKPTVPPVTASIDPPTLKHGQSATITVTAQIPQGFHTQSHTPSNENFIAYVVTMDPASGFEFSEPMYPKGEDHTYPALGTLNVYEGKVEVKVPVKVKPDAPAGPVTLGGKVRLQMCDDKMCFSPMTPKFTIAATVEGTPTTVPATAIPTTTPAAASFESEPAESEDKEGFTVWGAFGVALMAGLLFNVMPCVLPVLPLKAAAFYRAAEHHRSRSVMLGFAFSLGIIAVFALLAVLVLVLRVISWGSLFSNPWFVWPLVALLVACALGMFGAINVTLPTALYGVDPRQDTFGGNVVFGAFTAILATPCTAPLLPPLLIWASAQPSYVGVPAMLMVGVGMALPYLILSAFPEAARKFPQTGPWAELFKQMMGFMLLAAAAYFAGGRLIHGAAFWWLVVVVIAVATLYLMARTVQLTDHARPVGISSALAVAMLGGAIWWTVGVTARGPGEFEPYSDIAFQQLRDSGKPVLVKFTANWCATCQVIEGTVFRDKAVWDELKARQFATLKVDLTDDGAPGNDLLLKLNPAGGIPLTAIFTPGKSEPVVLSSVYSSDELLAALNRATNGARASVE